MWGLIMCVSHVQVCKFAMPDALVKNTTGVVKTRPSKPSLYRHKYQQRAAQQGACPTYAALRCLCLTQSLPYSTAPCQRQHSMAGSKHITDQFQALLAPLQAYTRPRKSATNAHLLLVKLVDEPLIAR